MENIKVIDKKVMDLILIKRKLENVKREVKRKEIDLIIQAIENRINLLLRMFQINNL